MEFDQFWQKGVEFLRGKLTDGNGEMNFVAENWTATKGHTGEKFEIVRALDDGIKCLSIYASKEIVLPKEDMEILHGMWDDYIAGDVTRMDLIDAIPRPAYCVAVMKLLKDNIS